MVFQCPKWGFCRALWVYCIEEHNFPMIQSQDPAIPGKDVHQNIYGMLVHFIMAIWAVWWIYFIQINSLFHRLKSDLDSESRKLHTTPMHVVWWPASSLSLAGGWGPESTRSASWWDEERIHTPLEDLPIKIQSGALDKSKFFCYGHIGSMTSVWRSWVGLSDDFEITSAQS
jgi:hypothetical protein